MGDIPRLVGSTEIQVRAKKRNAGLLERRLMRGENDKRLKYYPVKNRLDEFGTNP